MATGFKVTLAVVGFYEDDYGRCFRDSVSSLKVSYKLEKGFRRNIFFATVGENMQNVLCSDFPE